ncbi:MAG: hypothetical protein K5873_00225 [Treponema sp.]|nr:hypothetical protein [Treponema sp.]
MKNFESQLAMLSYAERLAIIEYLVKTLQQSYVEEKTAMTDGFSGGVKERKEHDEAISEFKRGEYDTYDSFDDFLSEIAHEA